MPDERYDLDKLALPEEEALARVEGGAGRTSRYPEPSYSYQEKLDDTAYAYLRELWRRIRKHTALIFFLVLISTTVVTIEAFRTKSIYRAATTIELDKASRTVYRSGETTIESDEVDYPYFTSITMKTSIRFLKSRPVLEDVVLALRLDQNPRFLDVTSRKSIIESARTVLSRIKSTKDELIRPGVVESPDIGATSLTTRSAEESARLAPYVGVLSANLSGMQVEDTRMLMISADHTDPALAATIANVAARAFMESSYRSRVRRLTITSDWLDKKTRELEAKVQEAELNLANFASENNMIATGDAKENLTVEKLSNMWGQFLKAQVDRILKESLYDEVRQGRVAQLPEAYADPKTSAIRGRLDELTIQAAQYAGRYGPENPKVVEMNKQVAALQKQLDESRSTLEDRLKADYERTKRDERAFQEAFERARGDAVQQNSSVIRYGMLKQEVEISKSIYRSFLTQSTHAD